jgi:ABC-2 type transport system ATP-binding protein
LLKIIARILRPDRGEVEVAGRVVGLIELGAGFHPELTGRENIYINAALLGLRKCEIKAKMAEIIAFSGIEYAIDSPVRTYSSGMHARLGFAIAVHVQPDILLIDEILAVGDMQFTQKCYQALTRLKHNNTCIVMASHQLELLPQWCEQTLWLENGLMRAYGNTDEVVALYQYAYQKEESQLAF